MKFPAGLRAFIESVNSTNVKYVVAGGCAAAFHSHPRFTGDLDILVEASMEDAGRIVEAL